MILPNVVSLTPLVIHYPRVLLDANLKRVKIALRVLALLVYPQNVVKQFLNRNALLLHVQHIVLKDPEQKILLVKHIIAPKKNVAVLIQNRIVEIKTSRVQQIIIVFLIQQLLNAWIILVTKKIVVREIRNVRAIHVGLEQRENPVPKYARVQLAQILNVALIIRSVAHINALPIRIQPIHLQKPVQELSVRQATVVL